MFGHSGAQAQREELKSIWTDPFLSPIGAAGAEFRPIRPKMGRKIGGSGLEKWSPRPDLVDGCSWSGHRPVGLLVQKTPVFVSKTIKKSKKSKEIRVFQEIHDPRKPWSKNVQEIHGFS